MSKFKTYSRVTLPITRIDECVEATRHLNMSASEAVTLMIAIGLSVYDHLPLSSLCDHIDQQGDRS